MYVDGLLVENHGVVPLGLRPAAGRVAPAPTTCPTSTSPGGRPRSPARRRPPPRLPRRVATRGHPHRGARPGRGGGRGRHHRPQSRPSGRCACCPDVGRRAVTCSTPDADIPGWAALIAPSAGRLTTSDDRRSTTRTTPAICPRPAGSVASRTRPTASRSTTAAHRGTATFKWSRENGSVVQPVVEMVDPTSLRLASLGRDEVLSHLRPATGSRSSTTTPSSASSPG